MATISVCMIVKNEEKVLARCLDSLNGIYDELIIVDTGSTDSTKEIAKTYTDKIYDFEWLDDFSAARNFSFSKATCEYIYCADADEILDEPNRQAFEALKTVLDSEIDIVEMKYVNQLENGTVYNFDEEYRPKLYRRLRTFTFIEPVHEMVRLDPLVYTSDISIIHKPESLHSGRDIAIFEKVIKKGNTLSERLTKMYAMELLMSGTDIDFSVAADYFRKQIETGLLSHELLRIATIILSKDAEIRNDASLLLKYASYNLQTVVPCETAVILGDFYSKLGDFSEASDWYLSARDVLDPELCLKYKTIIPDERLNKIN